MASGLKDTLNYIFPSDLEIADISAYLNNTPIEEELAAVIDPVDPADEILIFTDMPGGSGLPGMRALHSQTAQYASVCGNVICRWCLLWRCRRRAVLWMKQPLKPPLRKPARKLFTSTRPLAHPTMTRRMNNARQVDRLVEKQRHLSDVTPSLFRTATTTASAISTGSASRLDYIQKLGADTIWLNPIYVSPLIDNGYDIADYRAIHPQYGTMEDFEQLLREAHEKGIRIIMDLVVKSHIRSARMV